MKRSLPFIIILVVLGVALGSAWYLTRSIPAFPSEGSPSPTTPQGSPSTKINKTLLKKQLLE